MPMTGRSVAFALCAALAFPSAAAPQAGAPQPGPAYEIAVLQGLDRVTARISTIRASIGTPVRFGSLHIVVRACHKRPPEETPESAAFLEIDDVKPGEAPVRAFSGWMFASSPALSPLEHPVYDVTVVDCMNSSNSSSESSG
jgi:hypothetical protein